jgi:CNT family concentrative nucleoside transporter
MERLISVAGLIFFLLIAYVLSESKKDIKWKTIFMGIALQVLFGVIILKTDMGLYIFKFLNNLFTGILAYTHVGTDFVFGKLNNPKEMGFLIFTMVLPSIIFMSALMSVLYHIGFMQLIIKGVAWVMVRVMGTSGAESLAAAANIFSGQTEAPLVVRPYLNKMTHSEIMALMTGGMATVAGGVFAAYVGMGIDAGHLLAASVMSAPAALVCAKLIVPETSIPLTQGSVKVEIEKRSHNVIDAATNGAAEGLKLALNVGAMLLVFIAFVAMFNGILLWCGEAIGLEQKLSFEKIFGFLFSPIAFLLGIDWSESTMVGQLLGKKLVLNEFVAYKDLQQHITEGTLSPRAIAISTYALCGFANFGSIAIQVGGIGGLAPERREDFAKLGIKCLIGGTLACLMTGAIAGIFI